MSEANAPTTNVAAESGLPSLDERIDSVFGPSESVGDADSPQSPAADAASPADSAAPQIDPLAKARAERKAKLAELNARSRASVDSKAAQREAEDLRKQLAAANERAAKMVDPSGLDPLRIIELGQRAGHTPQAIAEALRNAMGSPELAAAHAAKQAVDPVVSKLQADLQAALKRIDSFEEQQQTAHQQAQEQAALQAFASYTAQNAGSSPLSARFLEQHGAEEFSKLTKGAAESLPPNADAQALLDEIEDRLTELGKIYGQPANPQRPQANTPRTNTAAAQAPTHVTNTHAQGRSGVVDGHAALAKMSLIERANLAFDDG